MDLTPIIVIGAGMVVVAVAFIVFARYKGGPWRYMALGALLWAATIIVKQLLSTVLEPTVYGALYVPDKLWASGSVLFYVYVGLLTGATEVFLTWLLLRYTRLGRIPWTKVLAFGIGFGSIEALYLGFTYLVTLIPAISDPNSIPESALKNLQTFSSPLLSVPIVVERIGSILAHIFCSALLFYSVISGKVRWMFVSFAFKSLLDAVVGFAYFWGTQTIFKLWTIEAIILLFGCAAWWGTLKIQRRYAGSYVSQPTIKI
ncbi:MAG: YhfC family glutamic-type intramembrane protease [Acidobacteriaceae bacterium]